MTGSAVSESLQIPLAELEHLERDILRRRHIERYAIVRQYVYGTVLDCACGSGYGSHLLAKNPDVERLLGLDRSEENIEFAKREYASAKIEFRRVDISDPATLLDVPSADVLVSIETLEHLTDPRHLGRLADQKACQQVIITFPRKKTTHYNPNHCWDIELSDLSVIFPEFVTLVNFDYTYDTEFVVMVRHERKIHPVKRWR